MQTKHTIDMTKNHMNTTEPGEYAKGKQINYLKFVPRIQKTHSIAFMFFGFFLYLEIYKFMWLETSKPGRFSKKMYQ